MAKIQRFGCHIRYYVVNLEVRHPRYVGSINKEFCVLHVQSNTTIFYSSTVRIQLHVSALHTGYLQVEIQLTDQLYKMCGATARNPTSAQ